MNTAGKKNEIISRITMAKFESDFFGKLRKI